MHRLYYAIDEQLSLVLPVRWEQHPELRCSCRTRMSCRNALGRMFCGLGSDLTFMYIDRTAWLTAAISLTAVVSTHAALTH
jgi:hypothetical protein